MNPRLGRGDEPASLGRRRRQPGSRTRPVDDAGPVARGARHGRHTPGTQVNALLGPRPVTSRDASFTLAELAAIGGVPTPRPGEPLTDAQLGVVLRYLRFSNEPPRSYRQAVKAFRAGRYVGSEQRIRRVWRTDVPTEDPADTEETADETEDSDI